MRKFLSPIINLVNLILVGIAFGLAANTAVYSPITPTEHAVGNYYQLVWNNPQALGITAFFLFVVGVFVSVITLIPFKARKFVAILNGGMYIASAILTLTFIPSLLNSAFTYKFSSSLIGFVVLLCIAGGLAILMGILEIAGSVKDKE